MKIFPIPLMKIITLMIKRTKVANLTCENWCKNPKSKINNFQKFFLEI